jgi:acetoacetyl-CoA synthetase
MSPRNLQVRRQLWNHSNPQQTPVDDFRRHVNNKFSLRLSNYRDLWQWSVTDVGAFSAELWNFCEIRSSVPPTVAGIGLEKMWPPPKWFPSTRFNYTENLLHHTSSLQDKIAISACSEGGTNWKHVTWTQLYSLVGLWADALRVFGVTKGDRVAGKLKDFYSLR